MAHEHSEGENTDARRGKLDRFFGAVMRPFLHEKRGRRNRWFLLIGILILIGASISLVVGKQVIMKMLPFDNKSEFQVVLDMPEGTSLEQTSFTLNEIASYLATVPEVKDYQVYAGTAAPISFNGLVRQYYLREGAYLGDIQVNLVDKHHRDRKSHEIALSVRDRVQAIASGYDGNAKIVEVPPGPPVLSPLVAEIYGIDYEGQIEAAKKVEDVFEDTPDIVDVDDSVEFPSDKAVVIVDRVRAARLGLSQSDVAQALSAVLDGEDMAYIHGTNLKYAVPIRVRLSEAARADLDQVLAFKIRNRDGVFVPLSEIVSVVPSQREYSIHHKDLLPVVYVTGDMAGKTDSPLYGLFDISSRLKKQDGPEQWFLEQPENPYEYSLKWDGEWQVTYETFRDMGIAYSVGLLLIYLVIMAPIPLTVIGILPGHALLGAQFTATSMIGMIALAGIIVRNSILLVDFINQELRAGSSFEAAVVLHAKPIVLTALAAMMGAFFILDDPIFSGLAVALIFGLLVSTVLTLVVIPVVYYGVMKSRIGKILAQE